MTKIKSKKIMLVLLMGIIACLALLFICFGQNAYADEDEGQYDSIDSYNNQTECNSLQEIPYERTGIMILDSGLEIGFDYVDDLEFYYNKYRNEKHIEINLQKDMCFKNKRFDVDNGRTIDFNLNYHKIYNTDSAKNPFFLVKGTLNLNPGYDYDGYHGTIESAQGTTNASIVSDRGNITANCVDFKGKFTKDDECPDYASHLYFANMIGESQIQNCKFIGGCARYGGSVYLKNSAEMNSSVYFKGCTFEGCFARQQAGAIYNQAYNTSLKIVNTTFNKCSSQNEGGAVLAYGKNQKCSFYGVTIEECYSIDKKGGAIYLDGLSRDQVFTNCTFIKDTAQYGGAVYVKDYIYEGKTLKFNNCKFDSCRAGKQGGAIHNDSEYVNLKFNDTNFKDCIADLDDGLGGAISTEGNNENVTFNSCTIDGCKAHRGGAIYNYSNTCEYKFKNTNVKHCESKEDGGAIYSRADNENYCFDNSFISLCKAGGDGGAIFVKSCDTRIYGTTTETKDRSGNKLCNTSSINECNSGGNGGAIYTSKAYHSGNSVKIENLDFKKNNADSDGGAIETNGTKNVISKCYFENNHSKKTGGAIYGRTMFLSTDDEVVNVKNCEFYLNNADEECSTVYLTRWNHDAVSDNTIYYKGSYDTDKEFGTDDFTGFTAVEK